MSQLDSYQWGDEERCLAVPDVEGYRLCDREDADDALQQAVLSCPNTSREVFLEAMMGVVAQWVADADPSMCEDLACEVFESAIREARRLSLVRQNA